MLHKLQQIVPQLNVSNRTDYKIEITKYTKLSIEHLRLASKHNKFTKILCTQHPGMKLTWKHIIRNHHTTDLMTSTNMLSNYINYLKDCKLELSKKLNIAREKDFNDNCKKHIKETLKNFHPEESPNLKKQ